MPSAVGKPEAIAPDTIVHRIGGGSVVNLLLKPTEETLQPPGISVLLGGLPQEVADQMRSAFPDPVLHARLHEQTAVVGSTTALALRGAGFEVVPVPTRRLANHARIIHPNGVIGFSEENLKHLSTVFQDSVTTES